jgi:hypothetical protein
MRKNLKMINIYNFINTGVTKKIIVYLIYLVVITILLSEMVVRSAKNWIPAAFVEYLSPDAMLKVYNETGMVQDKNSYIYHHRPFQKLNWFPHVMIDENGFRNSIFNQTEVDTVLLGDSLIFAGDSKVDLGDIFREHGKSTLNLAMDGYAPQHYRDVYKKYVISKGIQHKNVIVNIFVGNDFNDSIRYPWNISLEAKGKTYFPWTINLIIGAVDLYKNAKAYNIDIKESKHRISLPYKEIGIRYLWFTGDPDDNQWNETEKVLDDILKLARQAGAKVSFVIIPSPASVYGIRLHDDFSLYVDSYNYIVNKFKSKYKNINIIDTNKQLAKEIEKKFLYIAESDCHFNTYGTRVFFDIINQTFKIENKL